MKASRFFLISVLITAVLGGLAYFVVQAMTPPASFNATFIAILVGFFSTLFAFYISNQVLHKSSKLFFSIIFAAMFGKMLIGIITVLIVAFKFSSVKKEYVFAYFFSYFIYTAFEVTVLLRNLRPISEKGDN